MNRKMDKIIIGRDLRPAYYDDFHCIMSACQLSCCKYYWRIGFDKKDYLALKKLRVSGELKERMHQALHRIHDKTKPDRLYGEFALKDGECPLLHNGLCLLQLEKGEKVLPEVCRKFPRAHEYSPAGYLEHSVSPACEAVLCLLWDLKEGISFLSDPIEEMLLDRMSQEGEFDAFFQQIRSLCIDILQDRQMQLPERILLMGILLRDLADHPAQIEEWLKKTAAILADPARMDFCKNFFPVSDQLLHLRIGENWRILTAKSRVDHQVKEIIAIAGKVFSVSRNDAQVTFNENKYLLCRERLNAFLHNHEEFFENLMVTLFFQLQFPRTASPEELWKSYVNFCNVYSFFRFMAVLSCHDETMDETAQKAELFRFITVASRMLIHNNDLRNIMRDELFENDSSTLAHMAILLAD